MIQIIIIGILLGVVLAVHIHKSRRFLFIQIKEIYSENNHSSLNYFLLFIAIQAIIINSFIRTDVISLRATNYSALAVIVGAFLFGIGVVVANYRNEGQNIFKNLFGNWGVVVSFIVVSLILSTSFFTTITAELKSFQVRDNSIGQTFGMKNISLAVVLLGLALYSIVKNKNTSIKKKLGGLWRPLYKYLIVVGIILALGLLNDESVHLEAIGLTTPMLSIRQFLKTGDLTQLHWSAYMLIALIVTLIWMNRRKSKQEVTVGLIGGALIALGVNLAGDCLIANNIVETAVFSWHGWLSLGFSIIGIWTANYLLNIRPSYEKNHLKNELV